MHKLLAILKRILEAAIRGYVASWGNQKAAAAAGIKETASIVVEQIYEEPQETIPQAKTGIADNPSTGGPIPPTLDIPGPTTFDKPVDSSYGQPGLRSNRKH